MDNQHNENGTEMSKEFIEVEFDGVEPDDVHRSVVVGFGLPLDIRDISPTPSKDEEFEALGQPKTRALGALDCRLNTEHPTDIEFDIGANFQASQSLFASRKRSEFEPRVFPEAPLKPFHLKIEMTSFHSSKPLSLLIPELEDGFECFSVNYATDETPCIYSCSVLHQLALVEFQVRVFATQANVDHLIEFRHLSGCRYSYSDVFKHLSEPFVGSNSKSRMLKKLAPLTLCTEDELAMPSLFSSSPSSVVDHEVSLLSDEAGLISNIQGVRAVGCSQSNINMCDGGFGVPLASRITELASSTNENDELRTVALGAIANMAATENISNAWLNNTVDTVVAGVEDDHPHIRREAMRSMESMAKKQGNAGATFVAKFVRAGMIPLLEIEASGGVEGQGLDVPAQTYARGALEACRA